MNEHFKQAFNGNAIYFRIGSLMFQILIAAGLFWAGATFERKTDFETYKLSQEQNRIEELKALSTISETMARLDERMKYQAQGKK